MAGWGACMVWLRRLMIVAALLLPASAAGQQASIGDFTGEWRGMELTIKGPEAPELPAAFLNMQIRPAASGFRIRWNALGRVDGKLEPREIDSSFVPTDRPGVFAFDAYQGTSLFGRLFASPATGNPLEGQILVWARIEAATLVVYGLSIQPSGGYDIHRHAWTLTGDGTSSAQYVRRTEDAQVMTVEGRLERVGG
jgi:hypothetical protein